MGLVIVDRMRVICSDVEQIVTWIDDDPGEKIVNKLLEEHGGPDQCCEKRIRFFVDDNAEVSSLIRHHLPQRNLLEKRDVINQVISSSFKNNHFPKEGVFCFWVGWKTSQIFFLEDRKRMHFLMNSEMGIIDPIRSKITEAYYIDEFFKVSPSMVFECLKTKGGLLDLLDVVIDCKPEMQEFFKKIISETEEITKKTNKKSIKKHILFCGPGAEIMPKIPELYMSIKCKIAQESLRNWLNILNNKAIKTG